MERNRSSEHVMSGGVERHRRYLADLDPASLPVETADVLIAGAGIAGLYTALQLRGAGRVLVLTKAALAESNTEYAQGGIAAAIGAEDSPRLHLEDTLGAGDGLCDPAAVEVLVRAGPDCIMDLVRLGTRFDRVDRALALGREAAHSRPRILHARGDATGYEIRRALHEQAVAGGVEIREDRYIVDALTAGGRCIGVLAAEPGGGYRVYLARATVLATGGAGHLYTRTTNPEVATGDGIAVAYRAGAAVADLEFVQFHPTALAAGGAPRFLISEAVRGEGARLFNSRGERFMPAYHAQAELAPRDVVARAVVDQMQRTGASCVYLDARAVPGVADRFPRITAECRRHGIDVTREMIPVAPAAHYMMGGVLTDLDGRTGVPGLYACGEVACTGIHGANRLASNSLLEGLVFGRRIAAAIRAALPETPAPQRPEPAAAGTGSGGYGAAGAGSGQEGPRCLGEVQETMWQHVGILREGTGLAAALDRLSAVLGRCAGPLNEVSQYQLANLATVGWLVARAALAREESRGAHYRLDFPRRDDGRWRQRIVQRRGQGLAVTEGSGCS